MTISRTSSLMIAFLLISGGLLEAWRDVDQNSHIGTSIGCPQWRKYQYVRNGFQSGEIQYFGEEECYGVDDLGWAMCKHGRNMAQQEGVSWHICCQAVALQPETGKFQDKQSCPLVCYEKSQSLVADSVQKQAAYQQCLMTRQCSCSAGERDCNGCAVDYAAAEKQHQVWLTKHPVPTEKPRWIH